MLRILHRMDESDGHSGDDGAALGQTIEGNKTVDVPTNSRELACERHCILYVACMTVNHGAESVNTVAKTGSESIVEFGQ